MAKGIIQVQVIHNIRANQFEVDLGEENAVLIYMIKAGLFIILHTEVPPAFEGHGIARQMAVAALEYAKLEGYKVRSYCSFTTVFIQRHPEYKSMLG